MADRDTSEKTGERIAKVMARAGLCSRREAEAWIAAGRVAVNGKTIASPALDVTGNDHVVVDGKPLPAAERTRLFLYHKPRGLVTTNVDPQNRPTIFGALPKHLPRLVSVGRLDLNTEGLLLLTNDGGLARVLEHPDTGWLRRYRVRAHGRVSQEALDRLRGGIPLDGMRYGPIEAVLDRAQGANVWLTFAIREGKNREVRNVLEHVGLKVNRLIRISFGPFQLGDLPQGAVEEIRTRHLREQLGERIARQAGADFSAPLTNFIPPPLGKGGREPMGPRKARPDDRLRERPGGGAEKGKQQQSAPTRPDAPATLPRKRGRDKNVPARSARKGSRTPHRRHQRKRKK
jgi:23S rRNA pseudouridine2605 synthase